MLENGRRALIDERNAVGRLAANRRSNLILDLE
jgi:hypothetical protein